MESKKAKQKSLKIEIFALKLLKAVRDDKQHLKPFTKCFAGKRTET